MRLKLFSKKICSKENHLIEEINKTKVALEAAYSHFQNVVDPDLIDSCIYELNAVQNRYKYLLKQAKEYEKNAEKTG
ncbi:YaaL family protein [Mobilitalea sibirica]|uniref:YaaL family protein n=1 Tax=Mobilitalea sibirica TaxID=1462919 RepID=A0A8J7H2X1_9FIRM|nr:YaaL family protein [Mobilitalea sibirica]MBH1941010.1 YaaL family protein [Mobilitalea sibirica]